MNALNKNIRESELVALQALADLPKPEYARAKAKDYLEFVPFFLITFVIRQLPLKLAQNLVRILAHLARVILKKRNEGALKSMQENLKLPLFQAQAILKSVYLNFAMNWLYLVRGDKDPLPSVKLLGGELLNEARDQGRGVLIAAPHLGSWERVARLLDSWEHPVALVVAVQRNPLFDAAINVCRATGRTKVLHNRVSVRHALKLLKAGGKVIVVGDVDIGSRGIFLPFLNRLASTPKGPAELALKTGALLYCGATYTNKSGDMVCELEFLADPLSLESRDNKEKAIWDMSFKMNNAMSKLISSYPEQWFWLQRRWKTPVPPQGTTNISE